MLSNLIFIEHNEIPEFREINHTGTLSFGKTIDKPNKLISEDEDKLSSGQHSHGDLVEEAYNAIDEFEKRRKG